MGRKLAFAALMALLLAGCGGSEPQVNAPPTTATGTEAPAGNGVELAGTGIDGESLDLADFRGKPVFVNVWSSW